MKKQTYLNLTQSVKNLSEILGEFTFGECVPENWELMEVLKAFNILSDLVNKPKSFASAKRIDTLIGKVYVYFNSYGELVVLDSDKKQMFVLDQIDDGDEFDIYKQLESIKHPNDLKAFSFCHTLDYSKNKREEFIRDLKFGDYFQTSNYESELFRIGEYNLFFVY